jgi:hypothetical protein
MQAYWTQQEVKHELQASGLLISVLQDQDTAKMYRNAVGCDEACWISLLCDTLLLTKRKASSWDWKH